MQAVDYEQKVIMIGLRAKLKLCSFSWADLGL